MAGDRIQRALAQAQQHYHAGRLDMAERAASPLIRRGQGPLGAWHVLGLVAMHQERVERAIECFRMCSRLSPKQPNFHYLLGKMLAMLERTSESIESYDRALKLDPDHRQARTWKAAVLERAGRYDDAEGLLSPCFEQGTADDETRHVMVRVRMGQGRFREGLRLAQDTLANGEHTRRIQQLLGFLIGHAYDRLGEYDLAFDAFERANAMQHEGFDLDQYRRFLGDLRRVLGPDSTASIAAQTTERMVYIAGLPRSGTTLIETILDAHAEAQGVGERADFQRLVERHAMESGGLAYPDSLDGLPADEATRLQRQYLVQQDQRAPGASRIVNKHLKNWHHLGAVSKIVPGSRVVWIRRDPRDTCLGVYMHHFSPRAHGYATDLRMLGAVYREHVALMRYWIDVLDLSILEVPYERLVRHPESWTRRIVEFAGLEWDERCLRFYDSGRVAATHSHAQVRRPIYTTSVGRWQRYRVHLGPLNESLDGSEGSDSVD
ncbi:MAG: sulfotransferase [Phycisphaeraceae bacterium]|nr:sulfotransferase [Phycisphaeraceae bacterium]